MRLLITSIVVASAVTVTATDANASVAKLLRKGVQMATRGSGKAARETAESGARVVVRKGASASATVASNLGAGGSRALRKLSPEYADKVADISGELARSPYREQWIEMLARYGDRCANFLWQRKGSVAVAAGATAVLLSPADFMEASGAVIESGITVAGTHVVKPIITESARHVAAPMAREVAKHAAASFPWGMFWGCLGAASIGGLGAWYFRKSLPI